MTGNSNSFENVFTYTMDPPAVTANPTSQAILAGAPVSFTATADGTPTVTVQWQVSTNGGASFSDITDNASATTTTLSFTAAQSQSGNEYRAVFTNTVGTSTTTAATLTVNAMTLALSNQSVLEFRPVGTTVGTLSSAETGTHTYTYSLVTGTGSTDNSSFQISSNKLATNDAFDFAAKWSYSVRVRTTDETGQFVEQVFTITVTTDPQMTRNGSVLTITGTPYQDYVLVHGHPRTVSPEPQQHGSGRRYRFGQYDPLPDRRRSGHRLSAGPGWETATLKPTVATFVGGELTPWR